MKSVKTVSAIVLAVSFFAAPAVAKTSPLSKACKTEISKYCKKVKKKELASCLRKNSEHLSEACKAALPKKKKN